MIRRVLLALAVAAGAGPASAQSIETCAMRNARCQALDGAQATQPDAEPALATVEFLPHYTFHLTAAHLSGDDPRFVWDANFGGEVDLVGAPHVRATFTANYEVVLGEQFRQFDPGQGNYILAGSVTARRKSIEVAGVFHHESRHLSDRAKREAVDWNMVGGRVRQDVARGRLRLQSQADIRAVIEKSFVDYRWELDGDMRLRYTLRPSISAIVTTGIEWLGTDGTRGRGTQTGARGDGGIRIEGRGGALELFLGVERRIDPYPLESGTITWFVAGFRLLSRD